MIGGGSNIGIHLHGSGRAANQRLRILTYEAPGVTDDASGVNFSMAMNPYLSDGSRIMTFKLLTDVDGLDDLLKDLKRLQEGDAGADNLGSDLPTLTDHKLTARRTLCLEGTVYGHPILSDGKTIVTSELHAYLEMDGQFYARTLNRWYRLAAARKPRQDA